MGMKLVPSSIRGRLLLAAFLFTGLALLFVSLSIGEVVDRFIRRGLDESLDAEIALLARSVRPDGSIDRAMLNEIGPFTQHEHGWGWRVEAPGQAITSRTIVPLDELREHGTHRHGHDEDKGDVRTGSNPLVYARTLVKHTAGGAVTIMAAAPRNVIDRQWRAAVTPLLLSVVALGLFLLVATLLQLRIGLRPLARLKASLADIRVGRLDRVPEDQPTELAPVVLELNHLIDENAAALTRARGHVSNLAHGLKTPLATLSLKLAEPGRDPSGELASLADQIDRAIRHHLGRARAASPGAPANFHAPLAPVVAELTGVLAQIHAERGIVASRDIAADLTVRCDPQDLDEMLGNLLDNGWRWARARIGVSAARQGKLIRIVIDDDGPGLSREAIDQALVRGRRLDEREDGHGFGLPIARELAELHGGGLELGVSPLGGVRATLTLPG
jgi:signal transduction histidine kinase